MLPPEPIKRAMLEGALRKANDAVHADQIADYDYAILAYGDSCALLAQVMARTSEGCEDWKRLDGIVSHLPSFFFVSIREFGKGREDRGLTVRVVVEDDVYPTRAGVERGRVESRFSRYGK